MEKKVKALIQKENMISKGTHIIIGASGGGDSMALLWMLNKWKKEWPYHIYAVHVHHGLRGEEADRDAALVETFCKTQEIPFFLFHYKVKEIADENKIGTEEAGRMVRRQAFSEVKRKIEKENLHAKIVIALAHHANDLAETMIHHMVRGTGLHGLEGIRAVNGDMIRPFLCIERREIENYLQEEGIPYATDSTNLENDYTRNRIRHQILDTMIQEVNAKTISHMRELSLIAGQADAYLCEQAEEVLKIKSKSMENGIYLQLDFFEEKEILQTYGILLGLEQVIGKKKDISAVHVQAVQKLSKQSVGKKVSLPYQIEAVREYEGVWIHKKKEKNTEIAQEIYFLKEKNEVVLGKDLVKIKIFSYNGQKILEKKYTKWLDYDKIRGELSIRKRMPGDYLTVTQKQDRKKLKRYLIDEKIPAEQRKSLWLLAAGSEILWVIGYRISESAKVDSKTKKIMEITYIGGNQNE